MTLFWKIDLRESDLAYQLARNWNGCFLLCMAVSDEEAKAKAGAFLSDLISLTRLPKKTEIAVMVASFVEASAQTSRANLTILAYRKSVI